MTIGEFPGRSVARAHLSELVEMFGTDGCLRVSTASAPGATGRAPAPTSDASDTSDTSDASDASDGGGPESDRRT